MENFLISKPFGKLTKNGTGFTLVLSDEPNKFYPEKDQSILNVFCSITNGVARVWGNKRTVCLSANLDITKDAHLVCDDEIVEKTHVYWTFRGRKTKTIKQFANVYVQMKEVVPIEYITSNFRLEIVKATESKKD